tara:strand:- start:1825 stop:2604 length:780 start_codon:yes stop_codon:yes gene_type:complete
MRALVIAAGMGRRMGKLTKAKPKCLLSFGNKTLLEWTIEGLKYAGCDDIWIITGYQSKKIEKLGYNTIENKEYRNNNILQSFFKAKEKLDEDIIVTYSDIYVEKEILKELVSKKGDLILTVDKSWKNYYTNRKLHPIEQAEKVILEKDLSIKEIGKDLVFNNQLEYYEFIGLFKVSKNAGLMLKNTFEYLNMKLDNKDKFQRSKSWQNAYLTDFFQYIIDNKIHKIDAHIISKGWAEFDTLEDYNRLEKVKISQNLTSL